jgi:hypothetical protein
MNINKSVVRGYQDRSLKEIANAPVEVLQGVSAEDARKLYESFRVRTVRDLAELRELANLRFARWAHAIVTLSDAEE